MFCVEFLFPPEASREMPGWAERDSKMRKPVDVRRVSWCQLDTYISEQGKIVVKHIIYLDDPSIVQNRKRFCST
jgi:hypothetical protein